MSTGSIYPVSTSSYRVSSTPIADLLGTTQRVGSGARGSSPSLQFPSFSEFINGLTSVSNSALPWYRESNRNDETELGLRLGQNVQLAALGATTGAVRSLRGPVNYGRGGSGLNLPPWAPLAGLAVLAMMALKR